MTKVAPAEIVFGQLPGPTEEPISPALLAEVTGMGYSTVTRHLRALASAGRADKVDPIERGAPVLWFRTSADAAGSTPKTPARQDRSRPTAAAHPDGPAPTAASVGDPPLADEADVDAEARRPGNAGGGPVDHAAPAPAASTDAVDAAGVTPDHPQSRAGEPADARPDTETQATDPRPAPVADAEVRGSAEAGEPAGPAVVLPPPPAQPDPDRHVWMAAERRGLEFHRIARWPGPSDDGRTGCDRSMRTGDIYSRDQATNVMEGKPCRRCWPADDPRPVSAAPASGGVADVAEWMQSARPATPLPALLDAAPPDRLTEAEARQLTAEIRARVTDLLPLIKQAFRRRADLALGYPSWAAYCDAELAGLRMPLEERQQATAALHAEGMSTRAIAGALGTSDATVRRDLREAGATDDAPGRVVGLDGKQYASSRPKTAAEVGDLASADAGGEGLSSSSPAGAAAAPVAPAGAGATGVTRNCYCPNNSEQCPVCNPHEHDSADCADMTAAEGSRSPAPADGVDGPAGGGQAPPDSATTPAPSPAGPGGEGVTPTDPYIQDPAERAAWVAENASPYVRVIEGEAVETAVDPHDPGPVPEPPALDPAVRDRIENALNQVEMHIGDLATWLYQAGTHGPTWIHAVRTQRHSLDQLIRRLDQVDG